MEPRDGTPWKQSFGKAGAAHGSHRSEFSARALLLGALQCAAAVDSLIQEEHQSACVSVVGCNQQAIGARFGLQS